MGKNSFQFKQFKINQERCAMKVGTDGTLLGAWAEAPLGASRILDIGTGTGLIALMMAQRYPEANVLGVDIDPDATIQAYQNAENSPFANRVRIECVDAIKMIDNEGFDAIVCNPPFFIGSLTCPENQRTLARHTITLTYDNLMQTAKKLLKNDGKFSIIIPTDNNNIIETSAAYAGLFITRICKIKTTPNKLPKRQLIEFRLHQADDFSISEVFLHDFPNQRSVWYYELTKEFYIK